MKGFFILLPTLLRTIYFNFKYLPFSQAKKLPIWLHRPLFVCLHGKVVIDAPSVTRGMIGIGFPVTTFYKNERTALELRGEIVFKGSCLIGSGCSIAIGKNGKLVIGEDVEFSDNTKIICYHQIEIGANSSSSWDCTYCDTDFHAMKNVVTGKKMKPYAAILIGEHNWIGEGCTIMKGTVTPNYTTASACSFLNHKYHCEEKSILSGNPAEVVLEGCFLRDKSDDNYIS